MRTALLLALMARAACTEDDNVVQFVVHARAQSDVTQLFPGAQVDFTWNNIFIVTVWSNTPDLLVPHIRSLLDANTATMQSIIPPFSLQTATRRWLEYNLAWAGLLLLVFLCGCACGSMLIKSCLDIKRQRKASHPWPTLF